MKIKAILLLFAAFVTTFVFAQRPVKVKGYTKKNGTYVAPSVRSQGNKTQYDNYSSKGNYNPYTGKKGTKTPKK